VVSLVRALDLSVQRGVSVANLSLAGPENAVLTDMLGAVEVAGVLVVAAAGNAGPTAPPAWPAAHAGALAVTAVDPGGRIYRKAQRGPHVDIAAPGVEVWAAASVKGVKPRTGTSYAAPHVTAAAAILASRHPDWTPADLAAALRAMTVDAGAKGADEVFGAGILSVAALCGASAE
jgi:subtilisin family serine protease